MMECSGHYVYYEKNVEMQNYMIATRKKVGFTPSEIIEDRVTKNFRSLIREKNEKAEQKNHSRLVYGMSTFLVLVIVVIGVTMLNNYDKMQGVQDSLSTLNGEESKENEGDIAEVFGENVTSENQDEPDKLDDAQSADKADDGAQTDETLGVQPEGEQATQTDGEQTTQTDGEQTTPPDSTETPVIKAPKTYVVKKGDTLETISREQYGDVTRVNEICKINGLDDGNLIFIGQKLLLP
jgi:LysM repeat protein